MNVVVAPDSFKDALPAPAAAAAIAAGVRDAVPDARVTCLPLGDGGEGTGRVLAEVLGADERTTDACDPLGRVVAARWWRLAAEAIAIVEMAEASGLMRLALHERSALRTTSYGTGQVLAATHAAGCTRVLLCVGGSATVDGGAGCLQALGWRLILADRQTLKTPATGADLERIARIEPPVADAAPARALPLEILCDVDNPLLGRRGAAPIFAPQKGATPADVETLERGLTHWAELLQSTFGRDVRDQPGAGAAGGLPAGLAAALNARLVPGFEEVARRVGLDPRLDDADLCLTGEGRVDAQTAGGKVVAGVARRCRARQVSVVALVGAALLDDGRTLADLAADVGVDEITVITPAGTPLEAALAATADHLRRCAADVTRTRLREARDA